ncbi:MAG: hypothetical protein M3R24_04660, partial [Chloroflexota bacterium]|nr:hypothetical protein [Chloroflexota bacterium]
PPDVSALPYPEPAMVVAFHITCGRTRRWSRPLSAWLNVGDFHAFRAIFASATVVGGSSAGTFGPFPNRRSNLTKRTDR